MTRRARAAFAALLLLSACAGPSQVGPHPGEPWVGPDGDTIPSEVIALYADECPGRESAAFLDVRWPLDQVPGVEPGLRRYVRDPDFVLPTEHLLAPYDPASSLSRDTRFTGYVSGPFQLWVGADDEIYLYLVDGPRVEALPRAVDETVPCP